MAMDSNCYHLYFRMGTGDGKMSKDEKVYTVEMVIPRKCANPDCDEQIQRLVHQQEKGDNRDTELENRYIFVCVDCSERIMAGEFT